MSFIGRPHFFSSILISFMFRSCIPQFSYSLAQRVSLPHVIQSSCPRWETITSSSCQGNLYLFLLPGLSCFSLSCFSSFSLLLSTLLFALPCNQTLTITAFNRNYPKKHLSTASILNDQLPVLPRHRWSSPLPHLLLQLCQSPLELLDVQGAGCRTVPECVRRR